ncbi:MAG TPA: hypothetical protein VNQ53_08055, partial [Nocardioides sp.]|nr:hypothetical protein [Nocardioides sp.]
MQSPEELHQRGVTAMNRGRLAEARNLFERARGQLASGDLLARVETSLAYVWAETGRPDEALDLCADVLSRDGLSPQTLGVLHSQRGLLFMLRGESDAALNEFDAAIETLADPRDLGRAYLNRGGVHLQHSRTRQADADFRLAQHEYRRAEDAYGAAKAAHNLGYAQFLEGDLVGALHSMGAAYPIFAEQGPVMRAMVEQDRAEVLIAAGLVSQGREALRSAATLYSARRLHQRRGDAELTVARTLVVADPSAAAEAARSAARLFGRIGSSAMRSRAEAVALAAEVGLGRQGPALLARGDRLSRELGQQGLRWGATAVRLHTVRVLMRRGDLGAARDRLARVRVGDSAPLGVRLLARDVRAEMAQSKGRRADALHHLRVGLNDLHAWQSSFGSLDLQTNVTGHGRRLA